MLRLGTWTRVINIIILISEVYLPLISPLCIEFLIPYRLFFFCFIFLFLQTPDHSKEAPAGQDSSTSPLLRDSWETAERQLRDSWETAEKQLRDSWWHCINYKFLETVAIPITGTALKSLTFTHVICGLFTTSQVDTAQVVSCLCLTHIITIALLLITVWSISNIGSTLDCRDWMTLHKRTVTQK